MTNEGGKAGASLAAIHQGLERTSQKLQGLCFPAPAPDLKFCSHYPEEFFNR